MSALLRRPALQSLDANILNAVPILIWVVDDAGRLVEANRRFSATTRLPLGTVAPWGQFLGEDEAWGFQSAWMRSQADGSTLEVEARIRMADGQLRWHLIRMAPAVGSKGLRHWYATATDVHDQREISREIEGLSARLDSSLSRAVDPGRSRVLSASGERYRRKSELLNEIVDSLREAVVVLDAEGRVLLFNDAARRLLGTDLLAVAATDWPARRSFQHADGSEAELPALRALGGEHTEEADLWVGGPGDERRRFEARGIPLWDGAGGVRGAVAVFRDVTERRRMEDQLGHLQKLEAIGQLAAGIAHEINTPIQYVGDNLRFLARAFDDVTGPSPSVDADYLRQEVPTAVAQSLEGIDRVAQIVRAVREFAAPGEDRVGPVDLNRVVQNAIAVSRNVWKYVADVVTDLEPDLPAVPGVARDLNQAVYQLLRNAVEAAGPAHPTGGGRIVLTTRRADDTVELTVTDNGPGIAAALRGRVFDPFFTTKSPVEHSGQGLTRVLGTVVKRHHGSVELASEDGAGTAVTIRLPVVWPLPDE